MVVASFLLASTATQAAAAVGTISTFGPPLAGTSCANPEGLAIDLQGFIYTASDIDGAPTGTICVFSAAGALARTISIPAGPTGVAPLIGMLFEEPHTLFVADGADGGPGNGRLLRVNTQSNSVTVLASGFNFPNAIAEDLAGNLYVSDSDLGTINRISQTGSDNVVWASSPLFAKGDIPVGINGLAFDRLSRNLYATNTNDSRVLRIPLLANGNAGAVQIFADGPTIDANQHTTGSLVGPDGLAFDLLGNIYVAAHIGEIQVLSPSGHLIARFSGTGAATLAFPASVVFKGSQLYITNTALFDDGASSRITVLQAAFPGWPLN
jgi:sugar lactone lactonase YvrE